MIIAHVNWFVRSECNSFCATHQNKSIIGVSKTIWWVLWPQFKWICGEINAILALFNQCIILSTMLLALAHTRNTKHETHKTHTKHTRNTHETHLNALQSVLTKFCPHFLHFPKWLCFQSIKYLFNPLIPLTLYLFTYCLTTIFWTQIIIICFVCGPFCEHLFAKNRMFFPWVIFCFVSFDSFHSFFSFKKCFIVRYGVILNYILFVLTFDYINIRFFAAEWKQELNVLLPEESLSEY